MREAFLSRYPDRYDILIEYHVTSDISRFLREGRDRTVMQNSADGVRTVPRTRGMASNYYDCLRQLVEENHTVISRNG